MAWRVYNEATRYKTVTCKPARAPHHQYPNARAAFNYPYLAVWSSLDASHTAAFAACKMRKTAEKLCRAAIADHSRWQSDHTQFYIWDTRLGWNTESLACWTPIAPAPAQQWIP